MPQYLYLLILTGILVAVFFLVKNYLNERKARLDLLARYGGINDIDAAIKERQSIHAQSMAEQQALLGLVKGEREGLLLKYREAKSVFDKLQQQIKLYETDLENIDFGIHPVSFSYDTSEEYKEALKQVVEAQKEMVKSNRAARCSVEWTVEGSRAKGEQSTKRFIKLMLKAFNGECDSLIAKVKWNNINKVEERIRRTFDSLNKLGESNKSFIERKYLELKLKELNLAYEYEVKKYEEKEEQRRIREEMREEEKAARELRKAEEEARKEEDRYQKALDKAKEELAKGEGMENDQLMAQIAGLERQLEEAHQASQRAISRAQETKSGHVYVISNVGSFGEDVIKIGMTRRLEPLDRVKELGDASVPFDFDVHALIYSDNAPELENLLHRSFHEQRVNLVNTRKEYFKAKLSDIAEEVKKHSQAEFKLTKMAEAKEYRETQALLKQMREQEEQPAPVSEFPDELV